jgi:hypothetical protein
LFRLPRNGSQFMRNDASHRKKGPPGRAFL